MKRIFSLTAALLVALVAFSQSDLPKPAYCKYKIVGHRGGAKEAGAEVPDNSLAALQYSIDLGLYACECDIYLTSDYRVVVAHAASGGTVQGLVPGEHTLEELKAAGTLANGETVPSLEEYIDYLMAAPDCCTKLWLDIKMVNEPEKMPYMSYTCAEQAVKIIVEKNAQNFCEFICTGVEEVMRESFKAAKKAGIPIAWMAARGANDYKRNEYTWANIDVKNFNDGTAEGPLTLEEFINAGIDISVYNVDTKARMEYYLDYYPQMKAVCTNYPKRILNYIEGKVAPEPEPSDPVEQPGDDENSLDLVEAASPSAAVYYNLQGVQVTPARGSLCIERTASSARLCRF